jgi:hypothetical protein
MALKQGWRITPEDKRHPRFERAALVLAILFLGSGCKPKQTEKWGAIVSCGADIRAVDASTTAVRARGLPDRDIPSLSILPNLQDLDFYGGWAAKKAQITDQGLHALSQLELPCLTTLFLGFTENITDAGLRDVAKLKYVKTLGLVSCPKLTDQGLAAILSMPSLEYLDLRASDWVTDHTLEILERANGLKTLCLSGCRKYTPAGMARLRKALPELRIDDREMNNPLK